MICFVNLVCKIHGQTINGMLHNANVQHPVFDLQEQRFQKTIIFLYFFSMALRTAQISWRDVCLSLGHL